MSIGLQQLYKARQELASALRQYPGDAEAFQEALTAVEEWVALLVAPKFPSRELIEAVYQQASNALLLVCTKHLGTTNRIFKAAKAVEYRLKVAKL